MAYHCLLLVPGHSMHQDWNSVEPDRMGPEAPVHMDPEERLADHKGQLAGLAYIADHMNSVEPDRMDPEKLRMHLAD